MLVGDVLGALNQCAGVGSRDDHVADEGDRVGLPAAEALGHGVGPVAEFVGRTAHALLGLG